jgi:hypothetical protein
MIDLVERLRANTCYGLETCLCEDSESCSVRMASADEIVRLSGAYRASERLLKDQVAENAKLREALVSHVCDSTATYVNLSFSRDEFDKLISQS